jgi:PqqD family protein of HPr-rel-A system
MDKTIFEKLLKAQKQRGKPFEITVVGDSMYPILFQGDTFTVQPCEDYEIGDILVFNYKQDELLVHRLLFKKDGKYFCKGDNSFRLEDMPINQIIGKVILINGNELPRCSEKLIALSYAVNRQFKKSAYDIEKTKQTDIYRLYKKIILDKREDIMVYQKNKDMDYIPVDETSLTVFDPDTGDAHMFDETGISILDFLDEPRDLDSLLKKLCEEYNASPEDIKSDVEGFLKQAVEKKVVLAL